MDLKNSNQKFTLKKIQWGFIFIQFQLNFSRGYHPLPPGTKYGFKKFEPKICAEENLVKLYIYSVSCPRGCRPLPPTLKYGFKNFEPKIYAEENSVGLYIYSVSVEFLPGLSPLTPRYKIWILKFRTKNLR